MKAIRFVRDIKTEVRQQLAAVEEHQAQRPVVHKPRRMPTYAIEIEFIEKGGVYAESEDSDIELVEEEVKVAIDLDAEVVEVNIPVEEEEGPTLAETLKEAAQEDTAGVRLRRRMDRLEKAEREELLSKKDFILGIA